MKRLYSVYFYNTSTRCTTSCITSDVSLGYASQNARLWANFLAALSCSDYKVCPVGENCVFDIAGSDKGVIVIAQNTNMDYEHAQELQQKEIAK